MELDWQNIGILVLALMLLLTILVLIRQEKRLSQLLKGKNARDLEDVFISIEKEYKTMDKFREDVRKYLENVENRLKSSIRATEVIRFNPWKGTGDGGNQSFVAAFLDEKGDGLVISTLYSREKTSVFSKPVKDGKSPYELTAEEKSAIEKSLAKLK